MVHENQADNAVVNKFDRSAYAKLLLSQTFKIHFSGFNHLFFQSPIKLRIMNFSKTTMKPGKLRFLIILPSIACMVWIFCVSLVPVKGDTKQRKLKIAIDAGHGGMDNGVVSDGLAEKNLTLRLAQLTAKEAESRGIEVMLTRNSDELPVPGNKNESIRKRVQDVEVNKADLLLSIHVGASESNAYGGVDAFISANETANTRSSKVFASAVLSGLQKGPLPVNNEIKQQKETGVWVLDKSPVPAVLLEIGYLTNQSDRQVLNKDENLQRLAVLLAQAVQNYEGQ